MRVQDGRANGRKVKFVDVDPDDNLVDVDLVDILFVILLSIADPKNAYFHGVEPQDHARTLSFEKSYPTH